MLGHGSLAQGALVAIPGAGAGTTTTLTASPGAVALVATAAALRPAIVTSPAAHSFGGSAALFRAGFTADAMPLTLSGLATACRLGMAETTSDTAVAGQAAGLRPTLGCASGGFALGSITVPFTRSLAADPQSYTVSWQTFSDNATLAANAGAFDASSVGAFLSYDIDLGGIGGAIVPHRSGDELSSDLVRASGTAFTKKRYRQIIDAARAEHEARRRAGEQEAHRKAQIKQAADAQARAALRARWAQEDAIAAAEAQQRVLQDALAALAGAQAFAERERQSAALRQAVAIAQRQRDDEEAALALLLLVA